MAVPGSTAATWDGAVTALSWYSRDGPGEHATTIEAAPVEIKMAIDHRLRSEDMGALPIFQSGWNSAGARGLPRICAANAWSRPSCGVPDRCHIVAASSVRLTYLHRRA